MNKLLLTIILFTTFTAAQAQPLRIVNVSAPAINCLFDPSCRVVVDDTTDEAPLPLSGRHFLQTRIFRGVRGSAAEGLYVYEYRLDLRNATGLTYVPCMTSLTVNFGAVVGDLDYDGDGKKGDLVFVVTRGGLGSVGLASAEKKGDSITFNFDSRVCAGGRPGEGQSTYFFGLVSTAPPKAGDATIRESDRAKYTAKARVPEKVFRDRLQDPLDRNPRPFEPPRPFGHRAVREKRQLY
jgi:hypothetical protein